jgi:hypothetical protein
VITFIGEPTGFAPNQAAVQVYPTNVVSGDSLFSVWTSGSDMVIISEPANLTVSGVIQAGTIAFEQAYNRLGDGTPVQAAIDASNDLLINGALEVKDGVYWGDKTSYLTINPPGCDPNDDGYGYARTSASLYKDAAESTQYWSGQVNLPHGATVTAFRVYYYDNSASDLTVYLRERALGSTAVATDMAEVSSSGTPGNTYGTDTTITSPDINNNANTYYIYIVFPSADTGNSLIFRQARITYTTTGP